MTNNRNKTLDWKATKILALVHSDLAGPIQPLGKEGYRYVLNFIDVFSGLIMLYFLKHKSDTLLATKKCRGKTELMIQNDWSWEIILVFRNIIWM